MIEQLNQRNIEAVLDTHWLGRRIYYYPVVRSTNDLLREMAIRGEPAGTIVITDFQSRGKGRLGRRWLAPAGSSLLFSVLFRPDWPAEKANWLTMIGGLACAESISNQALLKTRLKWPNDIVVERQGRWYKLGGLLLEATMTEGRLDSTVLGIGLNVNMSEEQLPEAPTSASSLAIELGRNFSRLTLLAEILSKVEKLYEAALNGLSPHDDWDARLMTHGRVVRVTRANLERIIEGVVEGTDAWGRLQVRDNNGELHTFPAGDVTLRS